MSWMTEDAPCLHNSGTVVCLDRYPPSPVLIFTVKMCVAIVARNSKNGGVRVPKKDTRFPFFHLPYKKHYVLSKNNVL